MVVVHLLTSKYFAVFTGYVEALVELLFTDVVHNPASYQQLSDDIMVPPSLCSQFQRPDRQEAVASFVSRFGKEDETSYETVWDLQVHWLRLRGQ